MIRVLDEQQSYEMLSTTTVGRVGFVADGRVQIYPVNFAVSGRTLLFRTTGDGLLGSLAPDAVDVSFEVDYHDPLGATAWSVLMHGSLSRAPEDQAAAVSARVNPWAGGDRDVALIFQIESIEGRVVRRD
ncbi:MULTISPECIES: pyridoxamine 5'-phosphate oxidase family protein [unclassified Microbacterium]|uniref:pyridoxamine 5'-phosphate oxidase family protein n=1 Tax=unclassified Microbacterium TaxID=2609290 RepID=UPI001604D95F|nr:MULTISPECIES: pyridoxamine 5'-phosphate oxidase family protein [unclassified Microbacterium]QNA91287.1 pyridoxamine 5'-phosphate oxidase family protein [Microbacterium sp. Se63.02b]QYM64437.1 pyridoxamine 5'-phosphate oxidase family protein [Microbacterium sp. Se5.02b]